MIGKSELVLGETLVLYIRMLIFIVLERLWVSHVASWRVVNQRLGKIMVELLESFQRPSI